jgi:protein-disulfide isomerase
LLLVVACRPKQSELDAINAKLDTLAVQQQQLIDNLSSQWAAERQDSQQQQSSYTKEQLIRIEQSLDTLAADIERLDDRVSDLKLPSEPVKPRVRPGRPDPKARYRVEVGKSHVRGRSDALITLVMWTDYQCPFCKRVQPTIEKVRQQYGKDIRVVMKHNPLPMHNRAMAASMAAEAAGKQGKFWKMHEKLYQDPRALTDENIERYASELGLNMKKFKRDLQDQALEKQIKDEQQQGSTLGARGTPAFFINGRFLSGAQPFDAFEALIDEELRHAKALVKKGTKKRNVYKTLIKDAKTKP